MKLLYFPSLDFISFTKSKIKKVIIWNLFNFIVFQLLWHLLSSMFSNSVQLDAGKTIKVYLLTVKCT